MSKAPQIPSTRPDGANAVGSKTFKTHWTPEDDDLLLRMADNTDVPLWVTAGQIPGGSTEHDCRLRLAWLRGRDKSDV